MLKAAERSFKRGSSESVPSTVLRRHLLEIRPQARSQIRRLKAYELGLTRLTHKARHAYLSFHLAVKSSRPQVSGVKLRKYYWYCSMTGRLRNL